MTILISILSFFVAIAILVGIHEFGHFWVARKLGIKIIRFAIGFGKPIWTYKSKDKDGTEYVLAAIPMGGYVKMLDEREGDVKEKEKHRAFNTQPVWKRFLVVLAGPMFNFFFAIAAFAAISMMGVDSKHPFVGDVKHGSVAAQSGFEHKDLIIAVNEVKTDSRREVHLAVLNEYLKNPDLQIHVKTQSGNEAVRRLDLRETLLLADEGNYFAKTGINFWNPAFEKIWAGEVVSGGAADKSGMKKGDVLKSIDGKKIKSPGFFAEYVKERPNKDVEIIVERNGEEKHFVFAPKAEIIKLGLFQRLKIMVFGVDEKSPKQKAVGRVGVLQSWAFSATDRKELEFLKKEPFFAAMSSGVDQTWNMSVMTLKVMGRLITGEASLKNISGPITIANYAGKSALIGLSAFLTLLAIVSLSLGVLNLLPVPMLDGGHLMYYIIEVVKGSPVSEKVEAVGMRIGMSLVGVLMVVAIFNDIGKII